MVLEKRKVVSALHKKGFEKDVDGKHIVLTFRTLDGVLTGITTHVSHGSKPKDLSNHLIGQMARQLKLSRKNFEKFALCTMKQTEFEKIVSDDL